MMDFGMPFLMETDTVTNSAILCRDLGLQFIEINMNFPQCQLSQLSADSLNSLKEKYQIYFTIHLEENLNVCEFNGKVRQAYLETAHDTIELAKLAAAPVINMHLAKGIYITLPDRREFLFQRYETEYLKYILAYRSMCEAAIGDSDIRIAVENTDGFMEHEKRAIELLLESPCFGLTLDIGHSHAVNDMDIPFYEAHLDRLIHMHAHDAKGRKPHLAFGDGDIDLKARLSMAERAGARVVLETKTVEALTRTVHTIQNMYQ